MESNPVKLPPNFDIRSPSASSEWRFWKCQFEDYLVAVGNDEASDKIKLSLLRNMMGPESTKVIQSFKLPKDETLSYKNIVEEIEKYVNPKRNEVFERYKFNERNAFQEAFTRFGYPEEIVADNNPFNSFECHKYYKNKDITLITSSPHYPKSNGMAEKAVHISKNILNKAKEDKVDYRDYVLCYNNTPLTSLNVSPSQILNSRRVRTLIPTHSKLLQPKVEENIHKLLVLKQSVNLKGKLVRKKEIEYDIGDRIVHKTDKDKYWRKGIVMGKCSEPRSYWIKKDGENVKIRRNIKHLKKSYTDRHDSISDNHFSYLNNYEQELNVPNEESSDCQDNNTSVKHSPGVPRLTTRSGRVVKPREILDL